MAQGPLFPSSTPIDAYGDGGFRFAERRHEGQLLVLPSGVYGSAAKSPKSLSAKQFQSVFSEADQIEFLILGMWEVLPRSPKSVRAAFAKAVLGLKVMDSGTACGMFNVLLGESRAVAAALIAVG